MQISSQIYTVFWCTSTLAKFGLALHPDKTRPIEFGRFAEHNRRQRGEGKPETFDFLGFSVLQEHTDKEFTMN